MPNRSKHYYKTPLDHFATHATRFRIDAWAADADSPATLTARFRLDVQHRSLSGQTTRMVLG